LRSAAPALLLAASVLLVHWPPETAEFAYDDRDFVVANSAIRSPSGVLAGLVAPFPPDQPERALYRPLVHLSYAVDFALFGDRARGWHAGNVALYLAVVLLAWWLLRRCLASEALALGAALLFSVHPVHCDAVDSVAGRSEILALLASLVALHLFLDVRGAGDERPRRRALLGSLAAYALACLSKESATVLPVIVVTLVWTGEPTARGARRGLRAALPYAAVLAAYLTLRVAVLGRFAPEAAVLADADLGSRLLTMGAVQLVYLRLLVFPNVLQVDFHYQALVGVVTRPNLGSLLGWLGMALLAAAAVRLAWRHAHAPEAEPRETRARRATALLGFAIFFAWLAPVSHVLDVGALAAERFLFAPSLGFCILLTLAGRRALELTLPGPARRPAAAALLLALATAGGLRAAARAAEWRDAELLWRAAARTIGNDVRVHANLASVHLERGELDRAEVALERARALAPDAPFVLGNLGALHIEQGRLDEADAIFRGLLARDDGDALAWYNRGRIAALRGDSEEAARLYRRALALEPHLLPARRGLEALSALPAPRP
jgi:tetratricopeptide (TPR) repeat protein